MADEQEPAAQSVGRAGRRPSRARADRKAAPGSAAAPTVAPILPDDFVPPALAAAFKGAVPPEELVLWAALTPDGRDRAIKRMTAVLAWEADAQAGSALAVAKELGFSRSRFYRMVSAWRARPSLASLGAKLPGPAERAPRTKLADAYEALREAVPRIVDANSKEKNVSALVRLGRGEVEWFKDKPGDSTIRRMFEDELRLRALKLGAGSAVVFDLCGVGVPGAGGIPHVMFASIDVNTRYIYGVAIGDLNESREAYRAVAADALARIGASPPMPSWAPRFERAQITTGTDERNWDGFFPGASEALAAGVQAKGAGARFGRDVRKILGESIGRIRLLPLKPGPREPMKVSVVDAEFTAAEAKARVEAEVVAYNAGVVARLGGHADTPPPGLMALLRLLAD